jgi:hypothetical protein
MLYKAIDHMLSEFMGDFSGDHKNDADYNKALIRKCNEWETYVLKEFKWISNRDHIKYVNMLRNKIWGFLLEEVK